MNINQQYDVPYHDAFYRMVPDTQLLKDIQKAINGEYSAIACYKKLASMTPTQDERDKILEIQKDEKRHLDEFSKIYTFLTGRQQLIKSLKLVQTSIEKELNSPLKMNKRL